MNKILAIGDSILKGVSYENGRYCINPDRFTDILEKRLNVTVENKGRMGGTVADLGKVISHSSSLLNDPEYDTVLLEYGGNDSNYNWQEISDAPDSLHICETPLEDFITEYRQKIKELQAFGKQVFLLSLPPIDAEKYFRWICKGRNEEAILHWLQGDKLHLMQWHEIYNLAVFKIGASAGVRVLDISSCFFSVPNYSEWLCEDGIHLNSQGHRVIADAIFDQLTCQRPY